MRGWRILFFLPLFPWLNPASAGDWPMWRYDAGRTASTPHALPANLVLQWARHLPPLKSAWENPSLQFDAGYEPVVSGNLLFVGSSRNDSVTAFSTESGDEVWRFYANGPVRFAPVCHAGRLYFGSDDGILYCLDRKSGKLVWKFRAQPDRKALGNERLISTWPVRGGPVLADGRLWFTAGSWPFEGIVLCSLDVAKDAGAEPPPNTATILDAKAFRSVAGPISLDVQRPLPQGYLALVGQKLVLPCGKAFPRLLDTTTGKMEELSAEARRAFLHPPVTNLVAGRGGWFFLSEFIYDYSNGFWSPKRTPFPVVDEGAVYAAPGGLATALDIRHPTVGPHKVGYPAQTQQTSDFPVLWQLKSGPSRFWLKAGNRLYGSGRSGVLALDLPEGGGEPKSSWSAGVKGTLTSMVAADDRLFVVTAEGGIHCFGADIGAAREHPAPPKPPAPAGESALVKHAGLAEGYCLAYGAGSGRMIEEVATRSKLQVVAVESDTARAAALRKKFETSGLYGERVIVHEGDPLDFGLPPYIASLIVCEDPASAGLAKGQQFVEKIFHSLRPYGGAACIALPTGQHETFKGWAKAAQLAHAEVERIGDLTVLKRAGALPGAADWTHEYGDPGNTLMSRDALVKAPLGVLWYGGPSEQDRYYFDRHAAGPSAIILEGKMLILGPKTLAAFDVYTGRLIWEKARPTTEMTPGRRGWPPGSGGLPDGNHLAAVSDAAYLACPEVCLRLSPATGETLSEFKLPDANLRWGPIALYKDSLVTVGVEAGNTEGKSHANPSELVVLDRKTGAVKGSAKARKGFPYFAVGNHRAYCVDASVKNPYWDSDKEKQADPEKALSAFDLETGRELWRKPLDMVATWVACSEEHDVVIVSTIKEAIALRGADGQELWKGAKSRQSFTGHQWSVADRFIIWHDFLIDQRAPGFAYDIKTGQQHAARDAASGKDGPWTFATPTYYEPFKRDIFPHGCSYAVANEHLMTYRAGMAAYVDLNGGGTALLDGFRTGCRNSLIPAGGVVSAPKFANKCGCGYSIYTSLCLYHVTEAGKFQPPEPRSPRMGLSK